MTISTSVSRHQRTSSPIFFAPTRWPWLTSSKPHSRAQRRFPSHITARCLGWGIPSSSRMRRAS